LAIDVLEHLPRHDTARALQEWHRILRPGGLLRLQVPDITAIGQLLREQDELQSHELFLHHMYGTQAYTGDFHLAGFTDRVMIEFLRAAGFDKIALECEHRWLLCAVASKSVGDDDPIAFVHSQGCHPAESDAAGVGFRWCERNTSVLLANVSGRRLDVEVELTLAGHWDETPVGLSIEGLGQTREMVLGSQPQTVVGRVEVADDGVRVRLTSTGPPVDAGQDARDLRFRLLDVRHRVRTVAE
jgi:hypothetical protein